MRGERGVDRSKCGCLGLAGHAGRGTMSVIMKKPTLYCLALAGLLVLASLPALAQFPNGDLIVEIREVDVGEGAAYTVGSQPGKPPLAPQHVRVRNGEKASLSVGKSMPMQWVQSASAQSSTLSSSGVSASSSEGSVTNGLTWMDSGQRIKVQPRWPGAEKLVTVDIEVQSVSVEARTGTELPDQSRSQFATTVSAPLGKWVSIAFTGKGPQSGVYGSEADSDPRRLLQIRVLAP